MTLTRPPMTANSRISIAFAALLLGSAAPAPSQTDVQARTRAITQAFNKKNHSKKTKNGITVEKYKEVRAEPAISPNFEIYSGEYVVEGSLLSLNLSVTRDGVVTGSGTEQYADRDDVSRRFTLRNARIQGALLTATKAYGNGTSAPLEGVFLKMTRFESPTDKGVTTFGIGMVGPFYLAGNVNIDKIFFERR